MRLRGERDDAQQWVSSLQSDLEREKIQKLEAKCISAGLVKDLA
jgi:hypothetical protein